MNSAKNILIIGATGIAGKTVIKNLFAINQTHKVIAAVRNIDRAKAVFSTLPTLKYRLFDLENPSTFNHALSGISTLFLLRPPHVSNVSKYFAPFIDASMRKGVSEIVFLSVQGAEKSRIIPHNKIERLIQKSGLRYCILRPSYFMQNLTTSLLEDIKCNNQLFVPAGNAIFNWVDANDVGKTAAIILTNFEKHSNKTYTLTGSENLSFSHVANIISRLLNRKITYKSPGLIPFYKHKIKQGMDNRKAIIMTLVHCAARFTKAPYPSNNIFEITGDKPTELRKFIAQKGVIFLK